MAQPVMMAPRKWVDSVEPVEPESEDRPRRPRVDGKFEFKKALNMLLGLRKSTVADMKKVEETAYCIARTCGYAGAAEYIDTAAVQGDLDLSRTLELLLKPHQPLPLEADIDI